MVSRWARWPQKHVACAYCLGVMLELNFIDSLHCAFQDLMIML